MRKLREKLEELEALEKNINVCIVGAGLMGKGLASQLMRVSGMRPSVIVSNKLEDAKLALLKAGVSELDIVDVSNYNQVNDAIRNRKFAISSNYDAVKEAELIDVVVDATGVPEAGAKIAIGAIKNGKHIIMLNVEADVVVGNYLNKLAFENGVVYTGSAGDEPGAMLELYDFAITSGFDVLALGKGKNNPLNYYITPDQVKDKALKSGLNPIKLASFIDGTNTMIELAAVANATGFLPDVLGCHGPVTTVEKLDRVFSLKTNGGILSSYGIVDYAFGPAPGVFAIITTDLPQVHHEMQFLKMGQGPNYTLFRPYHLTSLETPISIAKAYINGEASIAPISKRPVAEVVTLAKKDLEKGECLDGIGEYTVFGQIESFEIANEKGLLPIGLVNKHTRVNRKISKGEMIRLSDVSLSESSELLRIRNLQDKM